MVDPYLWLQNAQPEPFLKNEWSIYHPSLSFEFSIDLLGFYLDYGTKFYSSSGITAPHWLQYFASLDCRSSLQTIHVFVYLSLVKFIEDVTIPVGTAIIEYPIIMIIAAMNWPIFVTGEISPVSYTHLTLPTINSE